MYEGNSKARTTPPISTEEVQLIRLTKEKEISQSIFTHFIDAGLIYTYESNSDWILIVAKLHTTYVSLFDLTRISITLKYESHPPLNKFLETIFNITHVHSQEYSLSDALCIVKLNAPRPIEIDYFHLISTVNSHRNWLVVKIPWVTNDNYEIIAVEPTDLQ